MTAARDDAVGPFARHRADLVSLAYRMLGDMARAEDMVQEAWLRWSQRTEDPSSPRAYLITIVTRLCLNELDSAHARREESRSDRLPEPVALRGSSLEKLEDIDQVSMALLLVLQRLGPAERAVLLLHDVFDFDHAAIGDLVGKSPLACRKVLERARRRVAEERPTLAAPHDEHRRLLRAFLTAAGAGDMNALVALLAEDAIMITDGGRDGVIGDGVRSLAQPLVGAARIATFVANTTRRSGRTLRPEERELNGRPAILFLRGEEPFAALLLAVAGGRIHRVFFHADRSRLRYLADSEN
jgi:RNA polymerase sigma-70 factor (ECF subfamily)